MKKFIFPNGFVWGSASASYQIEGAIKEDGKGESIWDRFCQNPSNNINEETGEIACDHYHLYKDDVRLMKDIGLKAYRFSIAWSRIMPTGIGEVNQKGLAFYSKLIDELLAAGIEPYITIFHWDLPQKLQDIGGWTNREMPKYFENYCRVLYENFGGRVKKWITLNEPVSYAYMGYITGVLAPGMKDIAASLEVSYNLLTAHGRAVKLFREMKLEGEMGITLVQIPYVPLTDNELDRYAAQNMDGIFNRLYLDPIFKGSFPSDLMDLLKKRGITLPLIKQEDLDFMQQKIDFLGTNYYWTEHVRYNKQSWPFYSDSWPVFGNSFTLNIPQTDRGWTIEPEGLTANLLRLKNEYGVENLYITEGGASFNDIVNLDGQIEDYRRIDYLRRHFIAVHNAISAGVNIKGYFIWTLYDNYEWTTGFTTRFGIVYNDFETQKRTVKKSGYWYKDVIQENGLD